MDFKAFGHENVLALHRSTLEFTKEDFLTKNGDCILGIRADFEKPIGLAGKILIRIECDGITDELTAVYNPDFDSGSMVIRKSQFLDKRTFATGSSKAACEINRVMVERMKAPDAAIKVVITTVK
jgi:uncharacterized protein